MVQTFAVLLNQRYFSVIMNKDNKMVAFGVGLPYVGDALRKAHGNLYLAIPGMLKVIRNPRKVEMALIGVDPDFRNSGAHALMFATFSTNCEKEKIQDVVVDPILTTNTAMNNSVQWMDKQLRAKRQTFKKVIE